MLKKKQSNLHQLDETDLVDLDIKSGSYRVCLANSKRALEQALRLRFEVFNMELDEGLNNSYATGLDEDPFDQQMDHLIVVDDTIGQIVGTYRIQTGINAISRNGFYSAQEFHLSKFECELTRAVELGRACISKPYRKPVVLSLLWKAIEKYARQNECRWLFGCCSLTSQSMEEAWLAMKHLQNSGYMDDRYLLSATDEYTCLPKLNVDKANVKSYRLPKLFRAYMRLGVRVISEPAIDRSFNTIDFLVLCDLDQISFDGFSPISFANSLINKISN